DAGELTQAFMVVWAAGAAATLGGFERFLGREAAPGEIEPFTAALVQMGRAQTAEAYLLAVGHLQRVSRQVARLLVDHDVWLTPATAEPPPPLGSFDATPEDPLAGLWRAATFVPFTPIANVT